VKLENILVISNKAVSPYDFHFKLAKPGFTHFMTVEGGRAGIEYDAYGIQTYGKHLPLALNQHFISLSFFAAPPECYREHRFWEESNLRVKQSFDIWSYGCVLSEAAVWMGRGYQGLLSYRTSRAIANKSNKRLGDSFHDGKATLPTVFEWHNSLPNVLRTGDRITSGVLKLIEDNILLDDPNSRLDAIQIWIRAKQLIESETPSASSSHITGRHIPSSSPPAHNAHRGADTRYNVKASADDLSQAKFASTVKMRAAKRLPILSLGEAHEWRKAKEEKEKILNRLRFRKREVPKLPGDWLLGRLGKRDHVRR
jgi:serine/threonine protein kinase